MITNASTRTDRHGSVSPPAWARIGSAVVSVQQSAVWWQAITVRWRGVVGGVAGAGRVTVGTAATAEWQVRVDGRADAGV